MFTKKNLIQIGCIRGQARPDVNVMSLLFLADLRISQYEPTMYSVRSSGTMGFCFLHRAMYLRISFMSKIGWKGENNFSDVSTFFTAAQRLVLCYFSLDLFFLGRGHLVTFSLSVLAEKKFKSRRVRYYDQVCYTTLNKETCYCFQPILRIFRKL